MCERFCEFCTLDHIIEVKRQVVRIRDILHSGSPIICNNLFPSFVRLGIFYLSVILLVIESTLSEIFLLLTNRGLFSVKRMHTLFNGFRIWKFPGSVQNLLFRLVQPYDVVPAR